MKILVLIAGIADPKWPLPPAADANALQDHANRLAILSPFDEGALELALKLREAMPQATIHAFVMGSESFARKVAEWRLDAVQRLDMSGIRAWDAGRFANALAEAVRPAADGLVLIGREFGDYDDGSVPVLIANALAIPHVSLTTRIAMKDQALWATRQRVGRVERVRIPDQALLSVTNDPQNRLRHPLLKNVMAARRLNIPAIAAPGTAPTVQLGGVSLPQPAQRISECRMLTGDAAAQCNALAEVLLREGATA